MQAQQLRHEIQANNLANAATPGFKRDDLVPAPSVPTATQSPALGGEPLWLAAMPPPVVPWTDFTQGPIRETGRSLDVALNGPGFLVVETPRGERYTRAGALVVGPDGLLVTAQGERVLGERGAIDVKGARIEISGRGEVRDGARVVDTLRVVDFPAPYRLVKEGNGLFGPAGPGIEPAPATGYEIVAGSLESSNVNTVESMVSMIEILRSYEAAQRAIQAIDEINRQAANEIGRV